MVKRYDFHYDYHPIDPPPCACRAEESKEGFYVTYEDYKQLEEMYDEDMRRMRSSPYDFQINDVTQRTNLHAMMNLYMSWIIRLCLRLELRATHDNMVELREFLARSIDQWRDK